MTKHMHFRALASLTKKYFPDLTFTTLEIGARKIGPEQEVFYQLPEYFPGSTVLGFEPDDYECEKMNKEALTGFRYYPIALGGTEGNVPFYQTAAPMCNSLLRPNKAVNALYNNMHFAELNKESEVYTTTIDSFVANNEISKVDLIKIDIQGAELKAFEAATQTTTTTSASTIDTFAAATYRSAQYQIQITQGTNYHVTTLNVVHDGSQVYIMEFGTIRTGVALATFDADISSGNVRVRGTPTTSLSTVFKLSKVLTRV